MAQEKKEPIDLEPFGLVAHRDTLDQAIADSHSMINTLDGLDRTTALIAFLLTLNTIAVHYTLVPKQ